MLLPVIQKESCFHVEGGSLGCSTDHRIDRSNDFLTMGWT